MAQDRIAPIALPAGSFELGELQKALETAVGGKDVEQHPERINKAIVSTIAQPEILANADKPAIPFGAEEVDREQVYREGDEPVKTKALAFKPVKAEDGEAASKMSYVRDAKSDKIVGTDEPIAPVVEPVAGASSLSDLAAGAVAADEGKTKTST
jgi:hypothetical protein